MDYKQDSEAEWFPPEPNDNGDSCLSAGEDDRNNADDSNDDGFFVPDGYISKDEVEDTRDKVGTMACLLLN